MPRGVAIPDLRRRLFDATEHIVRTEGAGAVSGRGVTRRAGVAIGILNRHFRGLDGFLADYAVDCAFHVTAESGTFAAGGASDGAPGPAAAAFLGGLATPQLMAALRLEAARPDLTAEVRRILGDRAAALGAVDDALAARLAAAHGAGRLPPGTDPAAVALALTGTLHHLALTADTPEDAADRITATALALLSPAQRTTGRR
ncbi:TetR/AcrR family transcriptional regulator [Nocardiopsis coralliicola]